MPKRSDEGAGLLSAPWLEEPGAFLRGWAVAPARVGNYTPPAIVKLPSSVMSTMCAAAGCSFVHVQITSG